MFKRKLLPFAMATAIMAASYPHQTFATEFKSSDFLQWPADSQSYYFRTSIGMASFIVSFREEEQARCIGDWYFDNTASAEAELRAAMEEHPTYHPRGMIVWVLQKKCGKISGE